MAASVDETPSSRLGSSAPGSPGAGSPGWTQTLTLGDPSQAPARRYRVVVATGADRGRTIDLADTTLVVGSGATCDLVLNDGGVSRRHVEIAVVQGGVRIIDLDSKNGTWLLGARVRSARIGAGSELRVGGTTLRIDDADADLQTPELARLGTLWSEAPAQRRVLGSVARVAASDVPVLLEGEAGTGKRTLARALHLASGRAQRPLVEIDARALTRPDDAARALWGGPGAKASAATSTDSGALMRAHGGTLVLLEVTALPAEVYTRLVETLQSGVLLADARRYRVDVRVLSTSTVSINNEVRAGRFPAAMRDLVGVVRVAVPPLVDRLPDLLGLVQEFARQGGYSGDIDASHVPALAALRFPDNVRGLRSHVMQAVARGGASLSLAPAPQDAPAALRDDRDAFEKRRLTELMAAHDSNVSAAARAAGVDRRHLHRLLKKHGLRGG